MSLLFRSTWIEAYAELAFAITNIPRKFPHRLLVFFRQKNRGTSLRSISGKRGARSPSLDGNWLADRRFASTKRTGERTVILPRHISFANDQFALPASTRVDEFDSVPRIEEGDRVHGGKLKSFNPEYILRCSPPPCASCNHLRFSSLDFRPNSIPVFLSLSLSRSLVLAIPGSRD